MLYHGQRDGGGLHIRPGQMMRSSGGHEMMQQQAHNFPFHLNRPGENQASEHGSESNIILLFRQLIVDRNQ